MSKLVRRGSGIALAATLIVGGIAGPVAADEGSHTTDHSEHTAKQHKKAKAKEKAAKAKAAKRGHEDDSAGRMGVDDKGLALLSNGHHEEMTTEQPLTRVERAQLKAEIRGTIGAADTYPTVADALAAGYKQTGPYMPGIGAHFIRINGEGLNADGVMDPVDLAAPLAIIYDGVEPESQVAGFMYYSMRKDEPVGFAGANDVWHYHEDICLGFGPDGVTVPYGLDRSATKKQCEAVGGNLMKQTQWMVHVWSVPGWESRQGLFGEVNPALMCPDGSYLQRPPSQWSKHPDNICKSVP